MKTRAAVIFILMLTFLVPAISPASELVIITNENVAVSSFSANDVKQIFLGKKTTWDNGDKIIFVVQDKASVSDPFLKTYTKKSVSQYKNYWKQQVFTGKGKAPESFASDEEVVKFVSQTPGAVGYVVSGADTGNTKTVPVQ